MVKPFYIELKNAQTITLEALQPNETLSLVFSRKSDSIIWDELFIYPELTVDENVHERSFEVLLSVPETTSDVRIKFRDNETSIEQYVTLRIIVKRDLVSASLLTASSSAEAFSDANFVLLLINKSLAEHCVTIKSSLPTYSFEPVKHCIAPLSEKKVTVSVHAFMPGKQEFSFYVDSALFEKRFATLKAKLIAKPTVLSKLRMPFFAFPLNIQLLHAYLLNAILSLI